MNYRSAKLKKSKNDWFVEFYYKNPQTNIMERFRIRNGINRLESTKEKKAFGEQLENDTNAKLKEGWSPFPGQASIEKSKPLLEVMEDMKAIKTGSLRPRSIGHYKHAINIMRKFLGANNLLEIHPKNFTEPLAISFSDYLVTTRKLSGRSHNNYIEDMGNFFNMMKKRGFVEENYFKEIEKMPHDVGKNYAYTEEQRKLITNYLIRNKSPLLLVAKCIYYCFIRPNELVELKREQVNFESKQITIISGSGKNRKQQTVVIPDHFINELREVWEHLPGNYFLFGRGFIPGPVSVVRNRLSEAHRKILDDLKIGKEHTLYSWKHTGVVAAVKSGIDLYSLMRQLRHSSLQEMMPYLKSLGLIPNIEFSSKQPKF